MEGVTISPEELARIDGLAAKMIREGVHNELDEWMKDPKYLAKCREILEYNDVPYYAGCFALQALNVSVLRLFGFWSVEEQLNFAVWYDSLMIKHYELLWGRDGEKPAYILYTKLYGSVIANGWSAGSRFRDILLANFEKFRDDLNYVFCAVLGEIAMEMAVQQNPEFRVELMPLCLDYGFRSLKQADSEKSATIALEAIENILSFEVKIVESGKDNFPRQTYSFNVQSIATACSRENIAKLFEIATNSSPDKCFSILTLLCSANTVGLPRYEYGLFLLDVLTSLLRIPTTMPARLLKPFTRLLLRLKVVIQSNGFMFEQIGQFFEYVLNFTQNHMSHVVEESDAIQNLLVFWADIGSPVFAMPPEIEFRMRIEVAKCFIENSLKAFECDPGGREYVAEIFTLTNTKSINPMCLTLGEIVGELLPEFTQRILQPIHKSLLETTCENATAQMAFFCNCVLGMTHRLKLSEPHVQIMIETLQALFKVLLFDVYQPHFALDYVVCSLILFVRQFRNFEFMSQCGTQSQLFYSNFGDIHGIEQMLERLFRLTWDILTHVENREVLLDATLALTSLLEPRAPFHRFVMKLSILPDILRDRVEKPFPFLSDPKFTRCRVAVHQALCSILVHRDATVLRAEFLRMYDGIFTRDKPEIIGFLCDFAGFFRGAVEPAQWAVFFSHLFPKSLEELIGIARNVTDLHDAVHFVRFWSLMVQDVPRRIEFKHHSPNGVLLFNFTTDFLCQFDGLLQAKAKDDEVLLVKFLTLAFHAMDSTLSACYVPFAAYETFQDDHLKKMVSYFVRLASLLPVQNLPRYQKADRAVSHVNTTILTKHPMVVAQLGPDNLNFSMCVVLTGLKSLDDEVRRSSVESLETMVLRHFEILTKMDRQMFIRLTFRIWHLCLAKPGQYSWRHCLVSVIWKDKDAFVQACERMIEGSKPDKVEILRGEYQKLVEDLPELLCQKEGDVMKAVEEFVKCARLCVRDPKLIFDV